MSGVAASTAFNAHVCCRVAASAHDRHAPTVGIAGSMRGLRMRWSAWRAASWPMCPTCLRSCARPLRSTWPLRTRRSPPPATSEKEWKIGAAVLAPVCLCGVLRHPDPHAQVSRGLPPPQLHHTQVLPGAHLSVPHPAGPQARAAAAGQAAAGERRGEDHDGGRALRAMGAQSEAATLFFHTCLPCLPARRPPRQWRTCSMRWRRSP